MKRYPSGFVPANFKTIGKLFLTIGIITLTIFGFNYFINFTELSVLTFYLGVVTLILGIYLLLVIPKTD